MTGCDVIKMMVALLDDDTLGVMIIKSRQVRSRPERILHGLIHMAHDSPVLVTGDMAVAHRMNMMGVAELRELVGMSHDIVLVSPPCMSHSFPKEYSIRPAMAPGGRLESMADRFAPAKYQPRTARGKSSKVNNRERSKKKRQRKK